MRDSFNRTIEYLRVSLTPDCNLRCIYCMPENGCGWKNKSLTQAEFWRLIKLICTLGIKKIRLTGGEPLLYPNLADLIRKIKTSTQVDEIALTTNGILLEQKAEQLKKAGLATQVLAASFKNSQQVQELAAYGVEASTVAPDVIEGLIKVDAARCAVDVFISDFEDLCGAGKTMQMINPTPLFQVR